MKAKKRKENTARPWRYAANIEILYRTEIFLAALSIALAVVYSVGTWQSFMDSTLAMILNLISITALANIFLSIVVIAKETFASLSKKRKSRLSVIVSSLLFLTFSAVLLFLSHILIAVSEGF